MPKEESRLERQLKMSLEEMKKELPKQCDRGVKKGSKGYPHFWTGYKLHIDCNDGEIPISCLLSSASVNDAQVALPLMKMTADRVTSLYDLMDAAYDVDIVIAQSKSLGHVPIIKKHGRRKDKIDMAPAEKQRYKTRTTVERVNSRLKESFGGGHLRVKGPEKAMAHLMFGILVLTADQLIRLMT